ncbi:Transcription elongation factor, GreA/GreB family [Dyella jiangningensis]|uniref:GreA/GreB family elongation factor n=1 Tax=Dyella sp. AtDHG13 TaxID=1938897 RepID=UPI00088DF92F|nr:GreA/GreB family elongation factor [Dyella sp. AtDHG13]PXV54717.1 transcription elongation GreA/GreB family factor [Dyella sp. AtDHG13]SDK87593.1 Transcription elongation factor, GreA/GreB family [Dyella jiangningensis]
MSRSFVKDADESVGERLPDIPLSEHPNYVTPHSNAQLRERLVALRERRDALRAAADTLLQQRELAEVERELKWLNARVGSAIEVDLAQQPRDRVAFGALVTVDSDEGEARYRIVGEDEADVEHGRVSYVSPLARALLGARIGDEVVWQRPAGDLSVEVIGIDYPADP